MVNFPLKCKMYLSLLIGVYDEDYKSHVPKIFKKNY